MTNSPDVIDVDVSARGIAFWIHVTPRARRPKVAGEHDGALRVAVAAPPVEGKANAACCRAVAKALGCRPGEVSIDPASKGRRKRVHVTGEPEALWGRLKLLARESGLG